MLASYLRSSIGVRLSQLGLILLFAAACGDDDGMMRTDAGFDAPFEDAGVDAVDAALDTLEESDELSVQRFTSTTRNDRTRRWVRLDEEDTALEGAEVTLHGASESWDTTTGVDGIARFGLPSEFADGAYLFETGVDNAVTHNAAPNAVAAIIAGDLSVLTVGDSLPVDGGSPVFPDIFEEFASELTDVTEVNIAVSGTTTLDWAEGSANRGRLDSNVADADLVVVSLGGNDFLAYVMELFETSGMDGILEALDGGAEAEALVILDRVIELTDHIRAMNPNADIAYVLFPDYPRSEQWQSLIRNAVDANLEGAAIGLIQSTFVTIMGSLTLRLAEEDLVLVDLYRLTQTIPIDPLLIDPLHFTTEGHAEVGAELWRSIGGTIVGGQRAPEMHIVATAE